MNRFDFLAPEHLALLERYIDPLFIEPIILAPDGEPYLYRWHIIPYSREHGGCFLHLQVKSDPERPLHDHPWDNQSVILVGGYDEVMHCRLSGRPGYSRYTMYRRVGDVVQRKAEDAHRLILPPDVPYTITLFSMGPKRRSWGFWYPDGWHDNEQHVRWREDGVSIHV